MYARRRLPIARRQTYADVAYVRGAIRRRYAPSSLVRYSRRNFRRNVHG